MDYNLIVVGASVPKSGSPDPKGYINR